eukprot:6214827-Pleurochrysis_carterae.AAC.7
MQHVTNTRGIGDGAAHLKFPKLPPRLHVERPGCCSTQGVRGDSEATDDPTCAHHAITNISSRRSQGHGRRRARNDEIHGRDGCECARREAAMRTSVGWFSSPSCALNNQCAKYVALHPWRGYVIGATFRQWLDAEQYAKEDVLDGELLGSVENMLASCSSREYVLFIDAASVTGRFSQTNSLRTFLEEEADFGAEAGGKLRSAILTGLGSEGIMTAGVRAMAHVSEFSLWMLLRAIDSDLQHILDTKLEFFEKAAASPSAVIDGALELTIEGGREEKPTARARRATFDIACIRERAAGDLIVERLLSAAFSPMATSTRKRAAKFLLGALCAAVVTRSRPRCARA